MMLSDMGSVQIATQLFFINIAFSLWNLFDAHRCTRKANDNKFELRRKETKDPWLAVFLSNLLPGLGQAYQGSWLFAVLFFVSIVVTRPLIEVIPLIAVVSLVLTIVCLFHAYVSSPTTRNTDRKLIKNICSCY